MATDGGKQTLANLFEHEESEDDTPLSVLIASLPEINIEEVRSEAEEVKALMRHWQEKREASRRARKPRGRRGP